MARRPPRSRKRQGSRRRRVASAHAGSVDASAQKTTHQLPISSMSSCFHTFRFDFHTCWSWFHLPPIRLQFPLKSDPASMVIPTPMLSQIQPRATSLPDLLNKRHPESQAQLLSSTGERYKNKTTTKDVCCWYSPGPGQNRFVEKAVTWCLGVGENESGTPSLLSKKYYSETRE